MKYMCQISFLMERFHTKLMSFNRKTYEVHNSYNLTYISSNPSDQTHVHIKGGGKSHQFLYFQELSILLKSLCILLKGDRL